MERQWARRFTSIQANEEKKTADTELTKQERQWIINTKHIIQGAYRNKKFPKGFLAPSTYFH